MPLLAVWDDTRGAGQCRSCGAPITFFQLVKSGKVHPFDGDPIFSKTEASLGRLIGYVDTDISSSHFATCPQAKQWSSRR